LDEPVVPDAPDFKKSLDIDHSRDGEVMIAFAMNGEQRHFSMVSRCA
jgi:DMSO/TMAO reductase YedYZ molybdopterin-dependent catalytic subunit